MQIGLVYKSNNKLNLEDTLNSIIDSFNADNKKLLPNNLSQKDKLLMPRYYHYRVYVDSGRAKAMFFDYVLDTSTNEWSDYINKEFSNIPNVYEAFLNMGYFSTADVIY